MSFRSWVCASAFVSHLAFAASAWASPLTVGENCQFTDLQTALDSVPFGTEGEIHVRASYVGPPVRMSHKSIRLYGGYEFCDSPAPIPFDGENFADLSSLRGDLSTAIQPVLYVSGAVSDLDLRNFSISNGTNFGHNGGGIDFEAAHLELHDVDIAFNIADKGGGVFHAGSAGLASNVVLYEGTTIEFNKAFEGGGMRLEGAAYLVAVAPDISISNNHAVSKIGNDTGKGIGRGIELVDQASADIGSTGHAEFGVIALNTADVSGGGIELDDTALVQLFSTVPGEYVRIDDNLGFEKGGGVHMNGASKFCAAGAKLDLNRAVSGAAISTANPGLGDVAAMSVRFRESCNTISPADVPCVAGKPCNVIADNTAVSGIGTIINTSNATATFDHTEIRHNSSGRNVLLTVKGSINLFNCVVADNDNAQALIRSDVLRMVGCTITNNSEFPGIISGSGSNHPDVFVSGSLIWQPKTLQTLAYTDYSSTSLIDTVISDATNYQNASLLALTHVSAIDPAFVNGSANGDYHLTDLSPIDYSSGCIGTDLDGQPRGVDLTGAGTTCDPGAYELQQLHAACRVDDSIFCNDFD